MRITEIIQSKPSSAMAESVIQDVVPQDSVSEECVSAIAEGVSQILRRVKGKGLKPGFRCTSGPRKGRIVAKPSTCFMKRDTAKGAKIARSRQIKAKQTAGKARITRRSGGSSQRLKLSQFKHGGRIARPRLKLKSRRLKAKPLAKYNKIARPK